MSALHYSIYTDGGSRGNPGPAALGYVIYNDSKDIVAEKGEYIGVTTNNQAEYQAITAALEKVQELDTPGLITCYLDSELVVRQIKGIYKMKNEALKPWLQKIHQLEKDLGLKITFTHVPREKNKVADTLVNQALDGRE